MKKDYSVPWDFSWIENYKLDICIAVFFIMATFFYNFYQLLDNIQCFYHLPKLKAITLKASMMKNVYKIYKPLKYFALFKILCFSQTAQVEI